MLSKTITILDPGGFPAQGAYVVPNHAGFDQTYADADGKAVVKVKNKYELVTITSIYGKDKTVAFVNLPNTITLDGEMLDPVVIESDPRPKPPADGKKGNGANFWLITGGIAAALIIAHQYRKQKPKKVTL